MKSNSRKALLFLTSALAGVTAFAAAGLMAAPQTVSAASPTAFEMIYGAGLRVSDPTGMRFKTKIGADYYNELKAKTAKLYVAIIPYAYYEAYEADTSGAAIYDWLKSTYGSKFLNLEIPVEKIYSVTKDGETYYCANAVISNVRFNNYHLDFVGVAYMQRGSEGSYTYQDVEGVIEEDNARNVFEIACKANANEIDHARYQEFLEDMIERGLYGAYGVKQNSDGTYTYGNTQFTTYEALENLVDISASTVTLNDETVFLNSEKQLQPVFEFADGKDFEKEAYYVWSSSNEGVATVDENGVVTALSEGTTTITATGVGGMFSDTCTLTVTEKPTQVLSEGVVFMAQGNGDRWSYDTGAATFALNDVDFDLNSVTQVLCNGEEVAFSVDGSNVTFTNAPGGDQLYTFVTPEVDYVIGGCIYGNGISTVEELEAWRTSESCWYTVLLNDIDYQGATLTSKEEGGAANVLGTLDGRGYSISNFTVTKGFINRLFAAESAIKNVFFKNVTQDCSAWTGGVDYGVLGQWNNGTIENVYLQVHTTNVVKEHYGVLCFGMDNSYPETTSIHNVVVEVTSDSTLFHYIMMHDYALAQGNSSGIVGSYANGATESGESAWGTDSGFHQQLSWMIAEEANDELLLFTSPYWHIDASARTIALLPKGRAMLKKATVNINDTVLLAQGNGGKWSYDTGAATVDFSSYGAELVGVEKVLLDGEEFTSYSASGSTLTLNNAPGGDHTITVETGTHIYNATVCVYVNGISTVEELEAWRTSESYWYTVLLNDIDYQGATLTSKEEGGAANVLGTLDGRGYSISNFTVTKGFINRLFAAESAIKNVFFKNVTQDCSAWTGGVDYGVLGQWANGTIENVYLQVHTTNLSGEHYGVLCFGMDNSYPETTSIHNVVVEVTSDSTLFHYIMMHDYALAQGNSSGIVGSYANGATESGESAWGTDSGFHQQLSWMIAEEANDELLLFTSPYWVIDTNARTIDMKPYVCNYVAVENTVACGAQDGKTYVGLADAGIASANVSKVLVNGEEVEFAVNGNTLEIVGMLNGKNTVEIVTGEYTNVYTVKVNVQEILNVDVEGTYYNESGVLDLTGSGIDVGSVASVTCNGEVVAFTADGNALNVAAQAVGDYVYVIKAGATIYTVNVYACNVAISTADEFVAWVTTPTEGSLITTYAVLANDIVLDGSQVAGVSLYGTLDGRGYGIYNLTTSGTQGLFTSLNSGTFKNVQLINYTQNCNNAAATQGLFGDWTSGTVENLFIQGQIINLGANTHNGVLLHYVTGGTYNNIVAYLESDGTGYHYGLSMGGGGTPTANNVYFVSSKNINPYFNSENTLGTVTNSGCYASEAAMLEAVDFSSWAEPWTVNANGAPRMRDILRNTVYVGETVYGKGDAGENSAALGNVTLDFSDTVVEFALIDKILLDGAELTDYTISGNTITLNNPTGGDHAMSIYTLSNVYHVNVCMYGIGISTLAELENWRAGNYAAYTVLMNNIYCDGATLCETTVYKTGMFDGRGYAIADFKMEKGFVGNIDASGGVKNLQLVDVVQDCAWAGDSAVTNGVLGRDNMGTIENVLIKATLINVPNADHWGVVYMGAHDGSSVRNVIAYIESDGAGYHYVAPMYQAGTYTLENFKVITAASTYIPSEMADKVEKFATEEALIAAVDFKAWGGYWKADSKGAPMMKEYVQRAVVEFAGVYTAKGNGDVWTTQTGAAAIDLGATGVNLTDVQQVLCNGEEVAYSVSGTTLTLNNAPGGDQVYRLLTKDTDYRLKACVYVIGISTLDELKAYRDTEYYNYAVLLNDIDCGGAVLPEAAKNNLCGVFDGRGYTISNFTYSNGLFKGIYVGGRADAGIKNLQITGATQDCTFKSSGVNYGIFGQTVNGALENIYVETTVANTSGEHYGLLCSTLSSTSTARKVIVQAQNTAGTAMYAVMSVDTEAYEDVYTAYSNGFDFASSVNTDAQWVRVNTRNDIPSLTSAFPAMTIWGGYWNNSFDEISLKPWADFDAVVEDGYIVKDSETTYTVLVNSEDVGELRPAIEELKTLFQEATGVELRVIDDSYATISRSMKYISLGNTAAADFAEVYATEALGAQGYTIRTVDNSIYIVGEAEGVLYGVYELLNKTLNFEQYSKFVYTLDNVTELKFTEISVEGVPAIEMRIAPTGDQLNDPVSRQRMRMHSNDEVFMNGGSQHNMLKTIVPFDTYYSTNSTWFSNQTTSSSTAETTQLCYTAGGYGTDNYNAMKAVAVENVKNIILANPNTNVLSLTQMDVTGMWCTCDGCQAVINQYGGAKSATQTLFVNDVVSEVETWLNSEQGGREVQFVTFAYVDTETAPTGLTLNENVAVWIAAIEDNYYKTPSADGNALGSLLNAWSAVAPGGTFVWAYNAYFHNYMVGYNSYDVLDDLVKAAANANAKYFWAQGAWNTVTSSAFESVKAYVLSKLMWNPELDVNTLIDNFFTNVYGNAATKMREAFDAWRAEDATFADAKKGDIYNEPKPSIFGSTSGYFDNTYLKNQLTLMKAAIDALGVTEGGAYDSIVAETIAPRFLLAEYRSTTDSAQSGYWGTFETEVNRLGVTYWCESTTMQSYMETSSRV